MTILGGNEGAVFSGPMSSADKTEILEAIQQLFGATSK